MPAITGVLFLTAGILTFVGLGVYLWNAVGPKPPQLAFAGLSSGTPLVMTRIPTATVQPTPLTNPIPLEVPGNIYEPPRPALTPTPQAPWTYYGLDLNSGPEVEIRFDLLDEQPILLPSFTSHAWTPTLFSEGLFDWRLKENHGVVWEDLNGRLGLWLHSGPDEVMFPLQERLEREDSGYFRHYEDAQTYLDKQIGAGVSIYQGNQLSTSQIAAAVRVGPGGISALQSKVMDLVPYLAETYPGLGFESLVGRQDVLILYFCGRLLNGESKNPDYPYWQQARFIIAIVPEDS